jgi:Helix-turn-helix of DDE superfamily endonuclease
MLTLPSLRPRPARFRSLTGLTGEQFDQLVLDVMPRYAIAEERRLWRPNRQRRMGAGRKFVRPLAERLLLCLVWLRVYPTYEVLGALFQVDKGTVCHWLHALLPLLRETTAVDLQWPDPSRPKRDWGDLLRDFPDVEAIVDATEQRPKPGEQRSVPTTRARRGRTCSRPRSPLRPTGRSAR